MEKLLTTQTMTGLRKGDLVRHSGMLCLVAGFLKKRLGIKLTGPDDKVFKVTKRELIRKEVKRAQARTDFSIVQKMTKETPDFLYSTRHARATMSMAARGIF